MNQENVCFFLPGIGDNYQEKMRIVMERHGDYLTSLANKVKSAFGIEIMPYLLNNQNADDLLTVWSSNYVCDYLTYQVMREEGKVLPKVLLGYSMGLITCAACSQVFSFEDGITILDEIIKYRSIYEDESMVIIIGLKKETILSAIRQANMLEKVFIACENNELCYVLSGAKKDNLFIEKELINRGSIKTKHMETHFAFHSPYMMQGIERLNEALARISFKECVIPIFSPIKKCEISIGDNVREELIKNMYSTIKWRESVENIAKEEINMFFELGFNKGLTKMSKSICPEKIFTSFV